MCIGGFLLDGIGLVPVFTGWQAFPVPRYGGDHVQSEVLSCARSRSAGTRQRTCRRDKARENKAAVDMLPDLFADLDGMPPKARLLTLIQGVLAGNIFDWGAQACVDLYHAGTILDMYRKARADISHRPWRVDHYDVLESAVFSGADGAPLNANGAPPALCYRDAVLEAAVCVAPRMFGPQCFEHCPCTAPELVGLTGVLSHCQCLPVAKCTGAAVLGLLRAAASCAARPRCALQLCLTAVTASNA